jgi:GTPase SAR1 family protein
MVERSDGGMWMSANSEHTGLKVTMVGPEGAGKTVLVAVLAEFLDAHPDQGLTFRACDYKTKEYCQRIMAHLRGEEWPPSTRAGRLESLSWALLTPTGSHSVELVDPPGQELRRELLGESDALGIAQQIDAAALVILTIDIASHQSAEPTLQSQNAWIVENVLQRFARQKNRLIIVLTKLDQLSHVISEGKFGDKDTVLRVLRDHMPKFQYHGYKKELQSERCTALGVAAVKARAHYERGTQTWIPSAPLQSAGLPALVQAIVAVLRVPKLAPQVESAQPTSSGKSLWKTARMWVLVGVLVGGQGAFVIGRCTGPVIKPVETVTVKCSECGGDGLDEWPWPPEKCKQCGGKGVIERVR